MGREEDKERVWADKRRRRGQGAREIVGREKGRRLGFKINVDRLSKEA